ncbi:ABC transporter substrate-binding protein [Achromobacter marplatensis]|uniref:ABC transporter substrate-binding protein n=1 Tax=Achromobacter marplatensis TaxID=470868 RepID=UPI003C77E555
MQWTYTTYALSRGTATAVVKEGNKRWFILASDYAFGKQLAADTETVVKANGGEVVGTVFHPLNASDFASFLLQAPGSKAQIMAHRERGRRHHLGHQAGRGIRHRRHAATGRHAAADHGRAQPGLQAAQKPI